MPSIKFWVHPSNQTAGGSMKFETLRIFFGGSVAKFHLAKFHQSWPELKGIAALCNGLVSWMPFSWERWRQENTCQKLSWHIGLSQSVCQSSRKGLPSCHMQVRYGALVGHFAYQIYLFYQDASCPWGAQNTTMPLGCRKPIQLRSPNPTWSWANATFPPAQAWACCRETMSQAKSMLPLIIKMDLPRLVISITQINHAFVILITPYQKDDSPTPTHHTLWKKTRLSQLHN